MTILNFQEYEQQKINFFRKHDSDFTVETSPMDSYGQYYKIYTFADGSRYTEINRPVYEKTTVTVKGVNVDLTVKLFETEAYNTDNPLSVYHYEKFNHTVDAEV